MGRKNGTLAITDMAGNLYIFHANSDISIREYVEASVMQNRGRGSLLFNHGRRPAVVSGTIECKGGLAVPESTPFPDLDKASFTQSAALLAGNANLVFSPIESTGSKGVLTQRVSAAEQLSKLRALIGSIVTIDCREAPPGGVRGLFREGVTRPDLENDSGAFFSFEVIEDQQSKEGQNAAFGVIDIVLLQNLEDLGIVKGPCLQATQSTTDSDGLFQDTADWLGDFFEADMEFIEGVVTSVGEAGETVGDWTSAAGSGVVKAGGAVKDFLFGTESETPEDKVCG